MATIKKPDANPMLALLLSLFVFNLGHMVNGQTKKWVFTLVLTIVTSWFLIGLLFWILSALDAKETAERLKAGEEIDENEYSNELLYKVIKIVDSSATCKKVAPPAA